jgi:hypothetical protein
MLASIAVCTAESNSLASVNPKDSVQVVTHQRFHETSRLGQGSNPETDFIGIWKTR